MDNFEPGMWITSVTNSETPCDLLKRQEVDYLGTLARVNVRRKRRGGARPAYGTAVYALARYRFPRLPEPSDAKVVAQLAIGLIAWCGVVLTLIRAIGA